MSVDRTKMQAQLLLHEGLRLVPYPDTEGNETIGVGYNVRARGWDLWVELTGYVPDANRPALRVGALAVLNADIVRLEKAVPVYWPGYMALDPVRQRVALDLAFNIGFHALGFKRTIAACEAKDWSTAARELHKAHWALEVEPSVDLTADAAKIANEQIRGRADRLAKMLLTGQEPTDLPSL